MAALTVFFCSLAVVKEYEIIMLKYIGKVHRLYLIYFGAPEDIILVIFIFSAIPCGQLCMRITSF